MGRGSSSGGRDDEIAAKAAKRLGFARSTGDWQGLIADPADGSGRHHHAQPFHKPMALAAIAAGKPVYCEKPLAPTAADALAMAEAAEAKGVKTFVGFNYLKNPMTRLAREMVESGEIGEVWGFRGIHAEDYMTDPSGLWTWRLDPKGGAGAIADLGSHIISMARFVVGPIEAVAADMNTVVKHRPLRPGGPSNARSRSMTRPGRWSASPAVPAARSRPAGSRPAARCTSPSS